jgi:hypothetical protein
MNKKYSLKYDKVKKQHYVKFNPIKKLNERISVNYLINRFNQEVWKERGINYYFEMLSWLKMNYPEFLI